MGQYNDLNKLNYVSNYFGWRD